MSDQVGLRRDYQNRLVHVKFEDRVISMKPEDWRTCARAIDRACGDVLRQCPLPPPQVQVDGNKERGQIVIAKPGDLKKIDRLKKP